MLRIANLLTALGGSSRILRPLAEKIARPICMGNRFVHQTNNFGASIASYPVVKRKTAPSSARLTEMGRRVAVSWGDGGKESVYPAVWLRDNCQCPDCFENSAKQRTVPVEDLDIDVVATGVNCLGVGVGVAVRWADGHNSVYEAEWLKQRCFSQAALQKRLAAPMYQRNPWGKEMSPPKFRYDSVMSDDRVLYDMLITFVQMGLILITDAPARRGILQDIGRKISTLRNSIYGEVFHVRNKIDPSNLAYTTLKLGLHCDLIDASFSPGVQLLHTIKQSGKGGANLFSDGLNTSIKFKEDHPEQFQILITTQVDLENIGEDAFKYHTKMRKPIISVDEYNRPVLISYNSWLRSSVFNVPLETVEPFYRAMKSFDSYLNRPEFVIKHKMSAGEIVMFDNNRVLHGREQFDVSSERELEGAYMDLDIIYSKLNLLNDEGIGQDAGQ